jgi:hypothetical protein
VTLKEGEDKMRRKTPERDEIDDEIFERHLYVIGASINELNEQMEEVD